MPNNVYTVLENFYYWSFIIEVTLVHMYLSLRRPHMPFRQGFPVFDNLSVCNRYTIRPIKPLTWYLFLL